MLKCFFCFVLFYNNLYLFNGKEFLQKISSNRRSISLGVLTLSIIGFGYDFCKYVFKEKKDEKKERMQKDIFKHICDIRLLDTNDEAKTDQFLSIYSNYNSGDYLFDDIDENKLLNRTRKEFASANFSEQKYFLDDVLFDYTSKKKLIYPELTQYLFKFIFVLYLYLKYHLNYYEINEFSNIDIQEKINSIADLKKEIANYCDKQAVEKMLGVFIDRTICKRNREGSFLIRYLKMRFC